METPVDKKRRRGFQQQHSAIEAEEIYTDAAEDPDADAVAQHKRRRRASGSSESEIDLMLEELGIPDSGKKHKQQQTPQGPADVIELITPPRRVDGNAAVDQALASVGTTVVDLTSPELTMASSEVVLSSTQLSLYEVSVPAHQRARRTILSTSSLPSVPSSPVRPLDISVLSTPPDSPQQQSSDQECDAMVADLMRPLSERLRAARRGAGAGDSLPTSDALVTCVPIAQGGGFVYSSITTASATACASSTTRMSDAVSEILHRREEDDAIASAKPTTMTTARGTDASLNPVAVEKNAKAPRMTQRPANHANGRSAAAATTTSTSASSTAKRTEPPVAACVRMERSLHESDAGDALRKALATHVYNNKALMFEMEPPFDCMLANVIQWTRREDGDLTSSKSSSSPRLRFFSSAIYLQAHDFLQLLEERSYAEVRTMMQFLKTELQKRQQQSKRQCPREEDDSNVDQLSTFLIIEGMDRCLIDRKKKKQNNPGSVHFSFSDLHEMAFQLFMDTETHTKFTIDLESTASYVAMVTRELVLAATKQSNAQEELLESVPRLHSFRVTASGATMNNFANAWLRMLQMIPGVSEDKAQSILDYFPTLTSLLRAYSDPSVSQEAKEDLLADKLSGKHIERALSKRIFNVFCVDDPEAQI
ncbi:hypothetical protein FI667_g9490, partial [Globisporangium splendens]